LDAAAGHALTCPCTSLPERAVPLGQHRRKADREKIRQALYDATEGNRLLVLQPVVHVT
jgi:hypothetical protein